MEYTFPFDSGLGPLIEEFVADQALVSRRYPLTKSAKRREQLRLLIRDWQNRLLTIPFAKLSRDGQIDYALFRNYLSGAEASLRRDEAEARRIARVVPFGEDIARLDEDRMDMIQPEPISAAGALDRLGKQMSECEPVEDDVPAMKWLSELREAVSRWQAYYQPYDPAIGWWVRKPLQKVFDEFDRLQKEVPDTGSIPGRPLGREALTEDLTFEMLPYTPEELIAIGEREYAFCESEMIRASTEMRFGGRWREALEAVKNTFVSPGEQTRIVRGLALEAIEYVDELVTVPALAKESWRMSMMTAEAQKVNPFFLGGEEIIVSYPTDDMTHDEKRMSMRGNNPNFSRATVQHELIPGHHLQMYMLERHRKYRELFGTPFWIEGWTIYWELLLWDLGFPRTPEERIGMLFWRMHRCIRIVFSLRFHLGEMSTSECVDMLVERVGHERLNAEGEVRRSFNGTYPPLYQAAYMIGGLQFRAIAEELVGKGWTRRHVHDAMLRQNQMPPAMMRLALLGEAPDPTRNPVWRFD